MENSGALFLLTGAYSYWNLRDFAGKDATNDFEDIGHSDDARETMKKYYIGDIDTNTLPDKPAYTPPSTSSAPKQKSGGMMTLLQFLVPLLILGLAVGFRYFNKKE